MKILGLFLLLLMRVSTLLAQDTVETLVPEVVAVYPHDPTAYIQGLVLHDDGYLYESTGLYGGFSTMRKVDLETGEVLFSIRLPDYVFAEGLALVEDRFIQITWQNGFAFTYDLDTFADGTIAEVGTIIYEAIGWGLCYDGTAVYMSDGTSTLYKRDPETFEITETVEVTYNGQPITQLNELECVGDSIYANIWQTDSIMQIDKATGIVTAHIDATGLLTEEELAALGEPREQTNFLQYNSDTSTFAVRSESRGSGAVLNGIAYNPDTDTFLITGKLWPKMFEVRFVPQE
jgi:glutaminyl-peptide cyclotransferase